MLLSLLKYVLTRVVGWAKDIDSSVIGFSLVGFRVFWS